MTTSFELAILNVMLSVIGVLLSFIVSYRTASATSRTSEERAIGTIRYHDGKDNGVKASGVSLKHHLRGEPGLYYDDLYASKFPALTILPSPEDALGSEGDLDLDLDYNVDGAGTVPDLSASVHDSNFNVDGSAGTSLQLGSIMSCISPFEDNLAVRIILDSVYSARISRFCTTVWLFWIFLPFQLVATFGWHSITGALIASFIYLGFLAAGEEIEQPFGMST
ncbi:hypothetical protein GGU10DRAFT_334630 [Lentinula aff. detonsa]|uniref:Uncharacterized protein n=1 Tax=Lentinula aff. detonsa TaxID=2804958 RepID=A0AA38KQS7_9AGAR|nr:hypothetical protein GGU10DRAFT_334630 [Lentinula aff. detonsa]